MGSQGLFIATFLFTSLVFAQEITPELEAQLEAKVIQLQKIRSTHHQQQQNFLDEQEKLKNQIQNLASEKTTLENWLAHEQKRQAHQNSQIEKQQKFIIQTQNDLTQLAETVFQVAQSIQTHITHGIQFNKAQRLQNLDSILVGLKNSQPEIVAQALQNFLIFMSQELNTIRTVEIWNNFLDLENNQKKHAYQFRIGLIFQAFVTEDQTAHGLATPEWSSELTPKQIKQLTQALRTLQKRRAPELANLPFYYHAH